MGGNDSLLRMIGEKVEIDCPSLSKRAHAMDVFRDKVVRQIIQICTRSWLPWFSHYMDLQGASLLLSLLVST
jgi:hypothetical protein